MTDPLESFPFLKTVPRTSREAFLAQAVRKSLQHKQVLVRDGTECGYLPFVLEGTLRIFKTSESGREITLYRIERGESCVLTATCILNGTSFPPLPRRRGKPRSFSHPRAFSWVSSTSTPNGAGSFSAFTRRDSTRSSAWSTRWRSSTSTRRKPAGYLLKHAVGSDGAVTTTHVEIASESGDLAGGGDAHPEGLRGRRHHRDDARKDPHQAARRARKGMSGLPPLA